MPATGRNSDDADIDLGGLVSALWRRRLLVLMSTVVLGGLGFAGASVVSPKYQAETKILIETRSPDLARRPNDIQAADPNLDEAGVASQVELLQSADLIRQVARDLKLDEKAEFDPSADPSLVTRILVATGLMANPLDVSPEDRVIREFVRKLEVYQIEKSRVIAIQFSSKDPKLAAEIPNAMARVYLSLQSGAKLDTTNETAKWLEPEIANLREKVREAEAAVASYRSSSDLFRTGQQSTFSEQQLTDISQELARARAESASAEARAQSVRAALDAGREVDSLNEVVGSQMIQRLKETQSGIEGQIADLSTQLLDGHPRLKGLRSQLSGIRQQIRTETRKILASLESEASVARLRETQLIARLNTLKAATAGTEEKQVDLNALEREAAAQRQLLETYLARYREALSERQMNATPADGRIISTAAMPTEPYFPKTLPITVVATLAGLVLSAVYVMLAELFSGRAIRQVRYEDDDEGLEIAAPVRRQRDAEQDFAADDADVAIEPAVVAGAAAAPAKVVASQTPSLLSAADDEDMADAAMDTDDEAALSPDSHQEFSIAAVARHLVDNQVNLAIAVSLVGDPGSAATVAVARAASELGRRTILVDLTGSGVPTQMMADMPGLPGITDLLCATAAFSDTIHADFQSDAHVLPQGTADVRRAMRGADRLSMIVAALADAYELVLVECGPADVAGVSRLARSGQAEIILSAADASMDDIEQAAGRFIEAGYEDVMLLLGAAPKDPPRKGRRAA
jgi:exopolysaccharide transport family protein